MKNSKCLLSLAEIRKGALVNELEAEYERAIKEAKKTGQKATLSLTIEVKPFGEGQMYLDGMAKAKLPRAKSQPTLFFVTADGDLTRSDPGQIEMTELRVVDGSKN